MGIVLADSQTHANAAAQLVRLSYTNVQKPILTIDDAIEAGTFFSSPLTPVKSGEDISKALSESQHVLTVSKIFLSLPACLSVYMRA